MLQKFVFNLKCIESGSCKGAADLHGLLFARLAGIDPALTTELHEAKDKPFALHSLRVGKRENGGLVFQASEEASFRLVTLEQPATTLVGLMAGDWDDYEYRIGSAIFEGSTVKKVLPDDFTYHDLLSRTKSSSSFTLQFLTPTSFRQLGRQILFPLPEKVFKSLLNRWNAHSPLKYPEGVEYDQINVSRYELRTGIWEFERYKIAGCLGNCTYLLPKLWPEHARHHVCVLAAFAGLAGVGYKTTMGMGVTKVQWG